MLDPPDRLKRLGDEIRNWYESSRDVELRYAALIAVGDTYTSLSSLHSWDMPPSNWEVFPRSKRTSPPIACGSFRRQGKHKGIDYCYYGNISTSEWHEFRAWATDAVTSAVATNGTDFGPIRADFNGWMRVCFRLAWCKPSMVRYSVESDYYAGPPFPPNWRHEEEGRVNIFPPGPREFDPFASFEDFEAYEGGLSLPHEGRHFAWLSRDIRLCSYSAIETLLNSSQGIDAKAANPGGASAQNDRPPRTMEEWQQRFEMLCKTTLSEHQISHLSTVIDVLRETRRHLTTEQLLDRSARLSAGPLKQVLSIATKQGLLTNRRQPKPSGYGLPERDW